MLNRDQVTKESRKRAERYDTLIVEDDLEDMGLDFCDSEAQVMQFYTACRSLARLSGTRLAPEEAIQIITTLAAAASFAVSMSVMVKDLKKGKKL